jgi:hypothetical protein
MGKEQTKGDQLGAEGEKGKDLVDSFGTGAESMVCVIEVGKVDECIWKQRYPETVDYKLPEGRCVSIE